MGYVRVVRKLNGALAYISGALILGVGILAVFESISRTIFSSPTSWTLDLSSYFLIYLVFFGSAYAYQTNGHVAVDFLRAIVEKHLGKTPRRVMAFFGWGMAFIVVFLLLRGGFTLFMNALARNQLTANILQIPITVLYFAIIFGSTVMLLTIIAICVETGKGSDEFL
ncbi:MAG: TRAP transporter small permease subunit [Clostridiales Family XIII bacterium]|jgi:TRAP-type C4-dicarboxylate transport system permease small subunit|nr:TRAP transporter small permease subunit [Clostridiales Family XIII bacterium]